MGRNRRYWRNSGAVYNWAEVVVNYNDEVVSYHVPNCQQVNASGKRLFQLRPLDNIVTTRRLAGYLLPALLIIAVVGLAISVSGGGRRHNASSSASALATSLPPLSSSVGSATLSPSAPSTFPPSTLPTVMPDISGVGAIISAPPVDYVAIVSEAEALTYLSESNLVQTLSARDVVPPSNLRLVTYANLFGQTNSGAPDTPSVPAQPAWLAQYDNVTPPHQNGGGAGRPAPSSGAPAVTYSTAAPDPNYSCRLYVAISASTGSALDSFDYCTDF